MTRAGNRSRDSFCIQLKGSDKTEAKNQEGVIPPHAGLFEQHLKGCSIKPGPGGVCWCQWRRILSIFNYSLINQQKSSFIANIRQKKLFRQVRAGRIQKETSFLSTDAAVNQAWTINDWWKYRHLSVWRGQTESFHLLSVVWLVSVMHQRFNQDKSSQLQLGLQVQLKPGTPEKPLNRFHLELTSVNIRQSCCQ